MQMDRWGVLFDGEVAARVRTEMATGDEGAIGTMRRWNVWLLTSGFFGVRTPDPSCWWWWWWWCWMARVRELRWGGDVAVAVVITEWVVIWWSHCGNEV